MRAGDIHLGEVHRDDEDFLLLDDRLWPGAGRTCPATKLWPQNSMPVATGGFSRPTTIGDGDEAAVGDRVAALMSSQAPCWSAPYSAFFLWVPADGGGVEKDFGALHGGEAGGFGIPLVPTDQDADLAVSGFPGAKAEVARGEIKFS